MTAASAEGPVIVLFGLTELGSAMAAVVAVTHAAASAVALASSLRNHAALDISSR